MFVMMMMMTMMMMMMMTSLMMMKLMTMMVMMMQRKKTVEEGAGLDWAMGEALAFGTLLFEGNHVRITGQDVQVGG
jgi:2-oxoglutarate dehydrogenase complex dehydrogenase (E1) component-like enzyme